MSFNFPDFPSIGQIITGPGGVVYQWDGAKWVVVPDGGGSGGGADDAPSDGMSYGRMSENWTRVLAISGDVFDGGNF